MHSVSSLAFQLPVIFNRSNAFKSLNAESFLRFRQLGSLVQEKQRLHPWSSDTEESFSFQKGGIETQWGKFRSNQNLAWRTPILKLCIWHRGLIRNHLDFTAIAQPLLSSHSVYSLCISRELDSLCACMFLPCSGNVIILDPPVVFQVYLYSFIQCPLGPSCRNSALLHISKGLSGTEAQDVVTPWISQLSLGKTTGTILQKLMLPAWDRAWFSYTTVGSASVNPRKHFLGNCFQCVGNPFSNTHSLSLLLWNEFVFTPIGAFGWWCSVLGHLLYVAAQSKRFFFLTVMGSFSGYDLTSVVNLFEFFSTNCAATCSFLCRPE